MRASTPKRSILAELKSVLDLYDQLDRSISRYTPAASRSQQRITAIIIAAQAAIQRATGLDSIYSRQADLYADALLSHPYLEPSVQGTLSFYLHLSADTETNLAKLMGIVQAVREAVSGDYLVSVEEFIHAQVFTDFLAMADYLLETGYKNPAAVIAGTVLEQHLRKLGLKHGVQIETTDPTGKTSPKKAENLNADLAKQKVYGKNEHKQVTAWLGIRNSAAHGQNDEYDSEQVDLLIRGVRSFLARYPA